MPEASEYLRKKWGGDHDGTPGLGEGKAVMFLEKRGYYLTRDWMWVKPDFNHKITKAEREAMQFLIDEWDFGGCW